MSPQHDAAKALTHPLRAAILERLYAREALPIQPSAPSRWVRERQVRGAVEHTYTATGRISLKQEPL